MGSLAQTGTPNTVSIGLSPYCRYQSRHPLAYWRMGATPMIMTYDDLVPIILAPDPAFPFDSLFVQPLSPQLASFSHD